MDRRHTGYDRTCFYIISPINTDNHITCTSPNIRVNDLELLVDTESQVNILKINCLQGNLLVDETNKIYLKGINETIIQTLGKLTIVLVIEGKEIKTEFHLVPRDFPILKNGILGDNFLTENRSIINVSNKTIIIDTGIENN